MSRHHILPPIVYTPEPPKPKKTERRSRTSGLQKSDEAGEAEETGEVFVTSTPARAGVHAPQDPFTPVEAAEHRIPSTTGKLSEGTLKELLLAQEQESGPVAGAADAKR